MNKHFDVIIVGGGMIGACMALALAPLPLKIALVDQRLHQDSQQPSFDDRSIALSYGSVQTLKTLDVWPLMEQQAASINHIHISDKGNSGFARIHADDLGHDFLGYVIENRVAGSALYQALASQTNVTSLAPFEVTEINHHPDSVDVSVRSTNSDATDTQRLTAKLLIAADGSQSQTAARMGLQYQVADYAQSAVILNLQTNGMKPGWAYERFTRTGPLAFLPLVRQRYSVVWSVEQTQIAELSDLSDQDFAHQLQQAFGFRAGCITQLGQRFVYPLQRKTLSKGYSERVVFVGNALHTSHPVAGQGFNLGLRDVASLTEAIAKAWSTRKDFGNKAVLESYWQHRQADIKQTQWATDGLARLFISDRPWLAGPRNRALKMLDNIPPLKRAFARQAMGMRDDLSLLARGFNAQTIAEQVEYFPQEHA